MSAFFKELQRRKVYPVPAAYVVIGWLLIQAAAGVPPIYATPGRVLGAFTTMLCPGL